MEQKSEEERRKAGAESLQQRYLAISEENAKLYKEINMLKYKITGMDEEIALLEIQLKEETNTKLHMGERCKRLLEEFTNLSKVRPLSGNKFRTRLDWRRCCWR